MFHLCDIQLKVRVLAGTSDSGGGALHKLAGYAHYGRTDAYLGLFFGYGQGTVAIINHAANISYRPSLHVSELLMSSADTDYLDVIFGYSTDKSLHVLRTDIQCDYILRCFGLSFLCGRGVLEAFYFPEHKRVYYSM
jgi:hypothetical protein